jgi:hypothetical protein
MALGRKLGWRRTSERDIPDQEPHLCSCVIGPFRLEHLTACYVMGCFEAVAQQGFQDHSTWGRSHRGNIGVSAEARRRLAAG